MDLLRIDNNAICDAKHAQDTSLRIICPDAQIIHAAHTQSDGLEVRFSDVQVDNVHSRMGHVFEIVYRLCDRGNTTR